MLAVLYNYEENFFMVFTDFQQTEKFYLLISMRESCFCSYLAKSLASYIMI